MIEHTPHNTVIKGEAPALELRYAVVSRAILHVEESQVRQQAHEHRLTGVARPALELMRGENGHQPASAPMEVVASHLLLSAVNAHDALLEGLMHELLFNYFVCYHSHYAFEKREHHAVRHGAQKKS